MFINHKPYSQERWDWLLSKRSAWHTHEKNRLRGKHYQTGLMSGFLTLDTNAPEELHSAWLVRINWGRSKFSLRQISSLWNHQLQSYISINQRVLVKLWLSNLKCFSASFSVGTKCSNCSLWTDPTVVNSTFPSLHPPHSKFFHF